MASFLDEIFGSKPQVAQYTPTELPAEQLKSIGANISAFPQIDQLGSLYENYMLDEFNTVLPGFSDILASGGQLTQEMINQAGDLIKGDIPPDVAAQLQRSDAFQSLMSGTAGSGMSRALSARDLGLTSLNLINQGGALAGEAGNAAQRWAGLASNLIMSPSGVMITPEQQAQFTMQNNLYEQATKQLGYNIAAAPNPALQAANQWVEQVGGTLIGSYLGGGAGTKGANYKTSYDPSQYSATGNQTAPPTAGLSKDTAFNFGGVPTAAQTGGNTYDPSTVTPPPEYPMPYQGQNFATNPFDTTSTGGVDLWSAGAYGSNFGWN